MGRKPLYDTQVRAFGRALALHEGVAPARDALLDVANEHALLDVTGIVAWHSLISKVVDMSGFYSKKVPKIIGLLARLAVFCRKVRQVLWAPIGFIVGVSKTAKED